MELIEEATKVLNLRKNGFVIAPDLDFSDDGTRFKGYYYDPDKTGDKRFPTSKAITNGEAYIDVHYYNPETGKSTYFHRLNGVPYETAINEIKDLTNDIDAFKAKLDAGQIKSRTLSDEEYDEIKTKVIQLVGLSNLSPWQAMNKVCDKLGVDRDDLTISQRNQLDKDIESSIRNTKKVNPVLEKALAVTLFKKTLKLMLGKPGTHDYRGKYVAEVPPKTFEQAFKEAGNVHVDIYEFGGDEGAFASELIKAGLPAERNFWLNDLPDYAQEKIKLWVRKKLENFFDYDDYE